MLLGVAGRSFNSPVPRYMQNNLPEKYIITIGRSFGSGGRAVGRLIADRLGIEFYDKKLLAGAAERAGLNLAYSEQNDEKAPSAFPGHIPFGMGYYPSGWFGMAPAGAESIYKAQCEFIRELAEREACVIVGRSADYILKDCPNVVNVFIHAPAEHCARRIVERGDAPTIEKAMSLAAKTDKLRANFYNFYTDKQWGHSKSYHLCVDSSTMTVDDLADFIIAFARRKLAAASSENHIG